MLICCLSHSVSRSRIYVDICNATVASGMSGRLPGVLALTAHPIRRCLSIGHPDQGVRLKCKSPHAATGQAPWPFFSPQGQTTLGLEGRKSRNASAQKALALIHFWLKHRRSVRFGFPCSKIALSSFSFGEFSHK